MADVATIKRSRASQRDATRRRLIDATFSCLVEHGYAGTSTSLISQRAGVSHGALFNHFGSRDELMAACINEVFPRFMAEGSEELLAVANSTGSTRSFEHIVDVLWQQFSRPTMQAMRELMMVGRTNDALSASLASLNVAVNEGNVHLAAVLVPDLAGHPDLPAFVGLTLAAIDGAVFSSQAFRDPDRHATTRAALALALQLLVAQATTAPVEP